MSVSLRTCCLCLKTVNVVPCEIAERRHPPHPNCTLSLSHTQIGSPNYFRDWESQSTSSPFPFPFLLEWNSFICRFRQAPKMMHSWQLAFNPEVAAHAEGRVRVPVPFPLFGSGLCPAKLEVPIGLDWESQSTFSPFPFHCPLPFPPSLLALNRCSFGLRGHTATATVAPWHPGTE